MKIGIVVHGPGIIDTGYALKLINFLKDYGEIKAILGGTMGRTAVIDNSLENIIDISNKRFPSDSLKLFYDEKMDVIFLLNYGKSNVTGHVFGYKVYNNYLNKIDSNNIPIIQIERPGEEDGSIINWNNLNIDFSNEIATNLNLNIIFPENIHLISNNDNSRRSIHGVSANENILINGIVVGKSYSDKITLIAKEGYLVDIEGGVLKEHGAFKLGKIDLENVIVKTGYLRNLNVNPRILNNEKNNKTGFLNHAGVDVYSYKDCSLVVTIGDDTTLIASDILYRFNTPIIGITDGDLDKVVKSGYKLENSQIFQVKSGFDDIIGKKIYEEIFNSNDFIEISKVELIDKIKKIIENEGV